MGPARRRANSPSTSTLPVSTAVSIQSSVALTLATFSCTMARSSSPSCRSRRPWTVRPAAATKEWQAETRSRNSTVRSIWRTTGATGLVRSKWMNERERNPADEAPTGRTGPAQDSSYLQLFTRQSQAKGGLIRARVRFWGTLSRGRRECRVGRDGDGAAPNGQGRTAVSAEAADVDDDDGDSGLGDLVQDAVAADVHPAQIR